MTNSGSAEAWDTVRLGGLRDAGVDGVECLGTFDDACGPGLLRAELVFVRCTLLCAGVSLS